MAEGETKKRQWWELKALFPESALDVVLWAAFGAAGLFVILTIVGFSKASNRAEKLDSAKREAKQKIDELSLRPTAEVLAGAKARAAEELDTLRKGKDAQIESLTGKLKATEARAGQLESDLGATKKSKAEALESNRKLSARLDDLEGRYSTARRSASGRQADLLDKLEATGKKVVDLETRLAREKNLVAELIAEAGKKERGYEAALKEADQAIKTRDARIAKLNAELVEFPLMPLPDDLAVQKYEEILNEVARHDDREERIDLLFRAKLLLAGTSRESKADSAWKKERKAKRSDVDRAAKKIYGDVVSRVRLHSSAHDDNIRLLKEALAEVRGSSYYEKRVQRLIDREHELKAQGR
ncbi:MAG: hypothetical protein ACYSU0_04895 [Planctomycetota bacterium]|jgi:chromosome segregation ATPase